MRRMLLKLGTVNGEWESGNECTAVVSIRIQNGGQNDINIDMKAVSTKCSLQTRYRNAD